MKWERVLYRQDGSEFEDDFVDESFWTSLLATNTQKPQVDYFSMLLNTIVVVQELCLMVIFTLVFFFALDVPLLGSSLDTGERTKVLLYICALTLFLIYTIYAGFFYLAKGSAVANGDDVGKEDNDVAKESPWDDDGSKLLSLKTILILIVILLVLSPVMRTLTRSYSNDTIYALSLILAFVHLFAYDYSYVNANTKVFHGTLALNAAMFASVLLASRLNSNSRSFALLGLSIELFALSPVARHALKQASEVAHTSLTAVLVAFVTMLLYLQSLAVTVLFCTAIVFIVFVSPALFVFVQRYKEVYSGQWSIATLQDSDSRNRRKSRSRRRRKKKKKKKNTGVIHQL